MNIPNTSAELVKSFHVEDVTDDVEKVKITYDLVSESYAKLA